MHLFWKNFNNGAKLVWQTTWVDSLEGYCRWHWKPHWTQRINCLLKKAQFIIFFFTRNCYLCAARISFSPESAILSAPHQCCHQPLLSQLTMRPTFKVYTYNASSESSSPGEESDIYDPPPLPRYICPIISWLRCKYFDRPPANRYLISQLR